VLNRAGLVELLLDRCVDPEPVPAPPADPGAAVEELLHLAARMLAYREDNRQLTPPTRPPRRS
jgi:hypothetical protein